MAAICEGDHRIPSNRDAIPLFCEAPIHSQTPWSKIRKIRATKAPKMTTAASCDGRTRSITGDVLPC
jgi:hypothetical protein